VGRNLVSGGDVEIALRVAATGRPLWYTPACSLHHVIPTHRTTTLYMLRVTFGLGISFRLGQALTWSRSHRAWLCATLRDLWSATKTVLKDMLRTVKGPGIPKMPCWRQAMSLGAASARRGSCGCS
jgi:hypothetical protein